MPCLALAVRTSCNGHDISVYILKGSNQNCLSQGNQLFIFAVVYRSALYSSELSQVFVLFLKNHMNVF